MQPWLNIEPWWRFGAAVLIGALIGLEREFIQQRSGAPPSLSRGWPQGSWCSSMFLVRPMWTESRRPAI